jgi:hypothetical protein
VRVLERVLVTRMVSISLKGISFILRRKYSDQYSNRSVLVFLSALMVSPQFNNRSASPMPPITNVLPDHLWMVRKNIPPPRKANPNNHVPNGTSLNLISF